MEHEVDLFTVNVFILDAADVAGITTSEITVSEFQSYDQRRAWILRFVKQVQEAGKDDN